MLKLSFYSRYGYFDEKMINKHWDSLNNSLNLRKVFKFFLTNMIFKIYHIFFIYCPPSFRSSEQCFLRRLRRKNCLKEEIFCSYFKSFDVVWNHFILFFMNMMLFETKLKILKLICIYQKKTSRNNISILIGWHFDHN